MNVPKVGEVLTAEDQGYRDAIHVSVVGVVARIPLKPGERVYIKDGGAMRWYQDIPLPPCVGVVDPFLTREVQKGERFWLFVLPNTITSLRHAWTLPAMSGLTGSETEELIEKLKKAVNG